MVDYKVYRNSLIYTVCNFILKAMNFILLPLYTSYLSTADYGITGLIEQFLAVATILSTLGLQSAVMRFYIDYEKTPEEEKKFISTVILTPIITSLIFIGVFYIIRKQIMKWIFTGIEFSPIVLLSLIALVFTNLYSMYQQIIRGMENAKASAVASIAYLTITIVLNVVSLAVFRLGALGVIASMAISNMIVSVISIIHLMMLHKIGMSISLSIVKDMLKYSIPLIPHNLSTQIAQLVSGVLINQSSSYSNLGLYNLASKIGNACDTLQSSVSTAYQPWLFRVLDKHEQDYKHQIKSYTRTIIDIFILTFAMLSLFTFELFSIFLDSSYLEAWKLIPLIVIVYAIKTAYYFYIGILFYHKDATKKVFLATLTSSIINIILSYYLVPIYTSVGSIIADMLSMLIRVIIVIVLCKQYDDCPYRSNDFFKPIIALSIILVVGTMPLYQSLPYTFTLLWRIMVFAIVLIVITYKHKTFISCLLMRVRK